MSLYALAEGSVPLHLEFHVRRAVHHSGLFNVLRIAIAAWWNRPQLPRNLSARLRADMGFPPDTWPVVWPEASGNPHDPLPVWIPRL